MVSNKWHKNPSESFENHEHFEHLRNLEGSSSDHHWIIKLSTPKNQKVQPMSTDSAGLRAPRPLATRSCSANAEVPLASFHRWSTGEPKDTQGHPRNLGPKTVPKLSHTLLSHSKCQLHLSQDHPPISSNISRSISRSTAACHHMSP